jgi:hypothetical protein
MNVEGPLNPIQRPFHGTLKLDLCVIIGPTFKSRAKTYAIEKTPLP